ncbi:imidazolonepropionase [Belliella kenyensis]|uniref:Imidazolonepropionase n=1 Tax=Belliella kenyensis TaxID=1472724 RepID=A0ABV8ENF7_9BACT|nr:imidazolonepropionase [Belliella kenyensis]MCH7402113.1 imidazolonepropionase [Belliella kenyensis]MDN3601555.1 imidazolonepropionase [Belliella kenyensis]
MQTIKYTFIGPLRQAVTMTNLPEKGAIKDEQLHIIKEAGIMIMDDKIYDIGPYWDLYPEAQSIGAEMINLRDDYVALPGLIDCHTHICFGGSRAQDYAMRNAGKSYLEIAKAGGGIWDTVSLTRKTSIDKLAQLTVKKADRHLRDGITTIEVKSGYGLSIEEELKMLKAIKLANENTSSDLIPTCLAAHIPPKDFQGTQRNYLKAIADELFPILQGEGLANRIDAFIEDTAFTPEDIQSYFHKAKEMGFDITVHADQFHTGGSQVAVNFGAISADHLEASTDKEIALLAQSKTIAVALPGASMGLGVAYTPARKLLDAGASLAIASDWNPGSAPMGDLLMQAAVLGTYEKLSNAEVLAGITTRAAAALNLHDRGQLNPGMLADIILFPTVDYRDITYMQGRLKPFKVFKNGVEIN